MKNTVVLDASAVLTYLHDEPGAEMVEEALSTKVCHVSAANQAEVITKMLDKGMSPDSASAILAELGYEVLNVTPADGQAAGHLRAATRPLGLSLGDRICLALGHRMQATILTADRPWLQLPKALGLDIVCVRPNVQ